MKTKTTSKARAPGKVKKQKWDVKQFPLPRRTSQFILRKSDFKYNFFPQMMGKRFKPWPNGPASQNRKWTQVELA